MLVLIYDELLFASLELALLLIGVNRKLLINQVESSYFL